MINKKDTLNVSERRECNMEHVSCRRLRCKETFWLLSSDCGGQKTTRCALVVPCDTATSAATFARGGTRTNDETRIWSDAQTVATLSCLRQPKTARPIDG